MVLILWAESDGSPPPPDGDMGVGPEIIDESGVLPSPNKPGSGCLAMIDAPMVNTPFNMDQSAVHAKHGFPCASLERRQLPTRDSSSCARTTHDSAITAGSSSRSVARMAI